MCSGVPVADPAVAKPSLEPVDRVWKTASVERLDEERIDMLRRWGEGLGRDERDEVRAAGRAILLLIEEVEQLHVDLWNERSQRGATQPLEDVEEEAEPAVQASLRARLGQLGRKRREEVSGT
jgi:hypothetical protein